MNYTELEFWYPAISAISYYVLVFTVAEVLRKVVEKAFTRNGTAYVFFIEMIGTAQMCTCVYENGVMVQYYGVFAFFFTVASLLVSGGIWNRGAFVSPLAPIEAAWNGIIGPGRLLTLLSAEVIGGFSAFQIAIRIWYYTAEYAEPHRASLLNIQNCKLNYKIAFPLVVLFEIFGCFLIRVIVSSLPERVKSYSIPMLISGLLSFALVFVGVPGLNPVVASSRMFGCQGLDHQWFIAVYWICPIIGWLLGAEVQKKLAKKAPKKIKKKAN